MSNSRFINLKTIMFKYASLFKISRVTFPKSSLSSNKLFFFEKSPFPILVNRLHFCSKSGLDKSQNENFNISSSEAVSNVSEQLINSKSLENRRKLKGPKRKLRGKLKETNWILSENLGQEGKERIETEEDETFAKLDKVYSFILIRILQTCQIYLKSDPQERENIRETSRFFYVKNELDNLTDEQKQGFLEYINQYDEIRRINRDGEQMKNLDSKTTEEGKENEQNKMEKKKGHYLSYSQRVVGLFLKHNEEYGRLIVSLIMKFLNNENPDLLYYVNPNVDEHSIHKLGKSVSKISEKNKDYIAKNLTFYRLNYKKLLVSHRVIEFQLPPPIIDDSRCYIKGNFVGPKHKALCLLVFARVMNTCKIYLGLSPKERMNIKQNSRFYYVHKCLELLEEEKKEDFWIYLQMFTEITDRPLKKETRLIAIEKYIKDYRYGQILSKLTMEFLDESNPDFQCYIDPIKDEIHVGVFEEKIIYSHLEKLKRLLKFDIDVIYINFSSYLLNIFRAR